MFLNLFLTIISPRSVLTFPQFLNLLFFANFFYPFFLLPFFSVYLSLISGTRHLFSSLPCFPLAMLIDFYWSFLFLYFCMSSVTPLPVPAPSLLLFICSVTSSSLPVPYIYTNFITPLSLPLLTSFPHPSSPHNRPINSLKSSLLNILKLFLLVIFSSLFLLYCKILLH